MRKGRREAYALVCDDSGGENDEIRALAAVSGPARVMLVLERDLRKALALAGVDELKWSNLRTRAPRLEAARAFLDLAAVGMAAGALRLDILLWRPAQQSVAARERKDAERLRPLYARLWSQAVKAWPLGLWNLHPDQRTGMQWHKTPASLKRAWHGGGLRVVREAASKRLACVQLADLLAGLSRLSADAPLGGGERAWRNRQALRAHFIEACRSRGLKLKAGNGPLLSEQPRLSVKLLRRLPVAE